MRLVNLIIQFVISTLVACFVIAGLWRTVGFGDLPGDSVWEGIAIWLMSILAGTLYCIGRAKKQH